MIEVGAFSLQAAIHPGLDRSTGLTDRYADLGLDASFQKPLANGDVVAFDGRFLHERQALKATCALAGASVPPPTGGMDCAHNDLNDVRFDASYFWRDKLGLTFAAFDTFGSANPVLYADHRNFKPDSSGLVLQLDGTPFGDRGQPARRANLRMGVQYTLYTRFDGARRNFNGAGRNASDNNTVRVFTWLAF